jgi:hypothetical protein
LVGTDLMQAIPLTGAAALGAFLFGHVDLPVTTSIIVGSVPAVLVGAFLSSRVNDRYLRPAIGVVILASGLKYVGLGTRQLEWALAAAVAVLLGNWLLQAMRRRSPAPVARAEAGAEPKPVALAGIDPSRRPSAADWRPSRQPALRSES